MFHHMWWRTRGLRRMTRSLLQNSVSFLGLFCKRDLQRATYVWETYIFGDCDVTHSLWQSLQRFLCIRDTTRSYMTWLIHMRHDSLITAKSSEISTWLIDMWHDSVMCDMLIHTWHDSRVRHVTYSRVKRFIYMWHNSFICYMTYSYVAW